MPDMNKWLGNSAPLSAWTGTDDRAYDTARFIAAKSSSVRIIRDGSGTYTGEPSGTAQTMRIDPQEPTPRERAGANVVTADMRVIITGYKSHPTITDTDLRRGDRLFFESQMLTVTAVLAGTPDRLEAIAEAGR